MVERNGFEERRAREGVRIPVNRPNSNGETEGTVATVEDSDEQRTQQQEAVQSEAAEEWREKYLRLAADLENNKRRAERQYRHRAQQSQERLLRDLLPLADNLERALGHASPAATQTGLYSGVELTLRDFLAILARHGVERIEALGEPFDPELHEAVGAAPHPTLPPGTVMHVELPGYTYQDRLLRPARVMVVAG
jgi:molecular chaperone GrpE